MTLFELPINDLLRQKLNHIERNHVQPQPLLRQVMFKGPIVHVSIHQVNYSPRSKVLNDSQTIIQDFDFQTHWPPRGIYFWLICLPRLYAHGIASSPT